MNMGKRRDKVCVLIELVIEGDQDEAFAVVDRVLDAGTLQDAINDDDQYRVRVVSAVSMGPK
jgi:hypothetical protein